MHFVFQCDFNVGSRERCNPTEYPILNHIRATNSRMSAKTTLPGYSGYIPSFQTEYPLNKQVVAHKYEDVHVSFPVCKFNESLLFLIVACANAASTNGIKLDLKLHANP